MYMLIADDSSRMRETLRLMLSLTRDQVVECADGLEAVSLYERHRPAWVMMDISMPVLDGIAATARICALDPSARVVMVTDHVDSGLREAARRAGAMAFVPKEDLSQLLEIVGRA